MLVILNFQKHIQEEKRNKKKKKKMIPLTDKENKFYKKQNVR